MSYTPTNATDQWRKALQMLCEGATCTTTELEKFHVAMHVDMNYPVVTSEARDMRLRDVKTLAHEILSWDATGDIVARGKAPRDFQWAVSRLVAALHRDVEGTIKTTKSVSVLGGTVEAYQRNGKVELCVYISTVNAWTSLPSEIFLFSMIGQYLAHITKLGVGTMHLTVGRLCSGGAYARLCRMVARGEDDAMSDGKMGPYVMCMR